MFQQAHSLPSFQEALQNVNLHSLSGTASLIILDFLNTLALSSD